MCGSGVATCMGITAAAAKPIRMELPQVLTAFSGAARGTTATGSAAWPCATSTTRSAGAAISGSGSPRTFKLYYFHTITLLFFYFY